MVIITCPRCNGSGRYSFNLQDGTVCYGCMGRGKVALTDEQYHKMQDRAEGEKRRHAQEEEARAPRIAAESRLTATLGGHYRNDPRMATLADVPEQYHGAHFREWAIKDAQAGWD